ncbi:MAG TPA: hypothetical protein VFV75_15705 [Candidatus Polarisedimenticolaceae bacterium]|nr:hypothetical protein [Candidatus Polarisedimenticolaceae bacterium]
MKRIAVVFALSLCTTAAMAQEARPGDQWTVPTCQRIAGTSSLAITSDEGSSLILSGRPLQPTSYSYGIAVLRDVPNTMLLAFDRTVMRSDTAGCRWMPLGDVPTTSDGFPIRLAAARGDRAFAWSENRNDLARIDAKTITPLRAPVDSVVGLATHASDADTLRLVGGGSIWESTDGGLSFKPVGARIPTSSFLFYRGAFDPASLDHVVVGVAGGAYVTFDGGATWSASTGLSSTGTGPVNVFEIVVSPADPGTVFAEALDIAELDAGGPGRHIYLSRDGGLTFHPVVTPSSEVVLINQNPMAAHPINADVVYFTYGASFFGYGADLYRYDDRTGTVTKTHNTYHGLKVIDFNPVDPAWMYLGLSKEQVN